MACRNRCMLMFDLEIALYIHPPSPRRSLAKGGRRRVSKIISTSEVFCGVQKREIEKLECVAWAFIMMSSKTLYLLFPLEKAHRGCLL